MARGWHYMSLTHGQGMALHEPKTWLSTDTGLLGGVFMLVRSTITSTEVSSRN